MRRMRIVADVGATETTLRVTGATTAEIAHLLIGPTLSGAEVVVDQTGKGIGVRDLLDAVRA